MLKNWELKEGREKGKEMGVGRGKNGGRKEEGRKGRTEGGREGRKSKLEGVNHASWWGSGHISRQADVGTLCLVCLS